MFHRQIDAVVIGASAGAIEALSGILTKLPEGFSIPILIVVHLPMDRDNAIVDLFRRKCQIPVWEAEDKGPIRAGKIYFAPPDYHLLIEQDASFSLSTEPLVNFSRPSIDVLFETAADAYANRLVGIVLTGANHDGAAGLRKIVDAGGIGLVQHPETALVATMPQAALDLCPEAFPFTLEQIANTLIELHHRATNRVDR